MQTTKLEAIHHLKEHSRTSQETSGDEFIQPGGDPRASRPSVNGLGAWRHRPNLRDLRKNSVASAPRARDKRPRTATNYHTTSSSEARRTTLAHTRNYATICSTTTACSTTNDSRRMVRSATPHNKGGTRCTEAERHWRLRSGRTHGSKRTAVEGQRTSAARGPETAGT